jgi:hypothetical protein
LQEVLRLGHDARLVIPILEEKLRERPPASCAKVANGPY